MNNYRLAALLAAIALMTACVSQPGPAIKSAVTPPVFNAKDYVKAAESGRQVFELDTGESNLWILVDTAGPLAGLGHRHAISSQNMEGYALLSPGDMNADLRLPLPALQVDDPAARRHLGFDDTIAKSAIDGTRKHMLESLQTDRFPTLLVHIRKLKSSGGTTYAIGSLYLHGVNNPIEVPVEIHTDDTKLRISGSFQIRQTDYDITPYSALHGALQVADMLHISFSLTGRRLE